MIWRLLNNSLFLIHTFHMTTLTIKFKNNKQALLLKKLAEDLDGVEEIILSRGGKIKDVNQDSRFLKKYGTSEKGFYTRIEMAEQDIKEGRTYTAEEVIKRMKQRHAKDIGKV